MDEVSKENEVLKRGNGKKQKPGLNSVRPSEYLEKRFKELAEESKKSQTKMFETIMLRYLSDIRNENLNKALNVEEEVNFISKDLDSILVHIKEIVSKAQHTIIALESNNEQTNKNFNLQIDTLNKKIEELQLRNKELESTNDVFSALKENLESKIAEYSKVNEEFLQENKSLKKAEKENEKRIKDLEKNELLLEKQVASSEDSINKLKQELQTKDTEIGSLKTTSESLKSTLNRVEDLKKAEISSVEQRYKLIVTELQEKLDTFEDIKKKDIESLKETLALKYEAEKKIDMAKLMVELADAKSKYAEVVRELSDGKNKDKEN